MKWECKEELIIWTFLPQKVSFILRFPKSSQRKDRKLSQWQWLSMYCLCLLHRLSELSNSTPQLYHNDPLNPSLGLHCIHLTLLPGLYSPGFLIIELISNHVRHFEYRLSNIRTKRYKSLNAWSRMPKRVSWLQTWFIGGRMIPWFIAPWCDPKFEKW